VGCTEGEGTARECPRCSEEGKTSLVEDQGGPSSQTPNVVESTSEERETLRFRSRDGAETCW